MSSKIGLLNIGNTCFLNVVLQALRLTPAMGSIFLTSSEIVLRDDSKRRNLVHAFRIIMCDFWRIQPAVGSKPVMAPRGFFQLLLQTMRESDSEWYRHGQQADAAEALQYIMDSLHDAMYRPVRMSIVGNPCNLEEVSQVKSIESWTTFFSKEYSPIVENFNGQTRICVQCTECKKSSERFEPWLMIKAPLPVAPAKAPTMDECIRDAFASETLDDYFCETCKKKQKAIITNHISRLPPIVILVLKRFGNDGRKKRGCIPWDLNSIDFKDQLAFHRNPFGAEQTSEYETYAVIEHHGSTNGGHYIMFAKQDDVWNEYDDNEVRVSSPERVVSDDSYILFLTPKAKTADMRLEFQETIDALRARGKSAEEA